MGKIKNDLKAHKNSYDGQNKQNKISIGNLKNTLDMLWVKAGAQ